jgi:hypothetical protein
MIFFALLAVDDTSFSYLLVLFPSLYVLYYTTQNQQVGTVYCVLQKS